MEKSKGLVTIPTDLDVVPQTLELMKLWGSLVGSAHSGCCSNACTTTESIARTTTWTVIC